METLITSLTTSIGSMATDAMSAIGSILPVVLPIVGGLVVITVGVKLFKRFAKG